VRERHDRYGEVFHELPTANLGPRIGFLTERETSDLRESRLVRGVE
jgi:hypothetical protein